MSAKSTASLLFSAPPPKRSISEVTCVDSVDNVNRWIPSRHERSARTLVLCFDGTGDKFDEDVSNVIQFVEALQKDDRKKQLVYYQTGIGTYTSPNFITPITVAVSKLLDTMFAWNLQEHVIGGYRFLMQNYTVGDKISIFGFSRGAYVARALAGMLAKIGLLSPCNDQQLPIAWNLYTSGEKLEKDANYFKKVFSTEIKIDFVGVWDTVASVGIFRKDLPFVSNNTTIKHFRHALALDERRAKFTPEFYHANKDDETAHNVSHIASGTIASTTSDSDSDETDDKQPRALEVWFAGCHCDIGGGSVKNDTRHSLARVPLRWMIRECFACDTGIIFDSKILREEIGLNTASLYPLYKPRDPSKRIEPGPDVRIKTRGEEKLIVVTDANRGSSTEEYEDLHDALSAKYDQLEIKKFWWIVEWLPMSHRVQDPNAIKKKTYHDSNNGKGRVIYGNAKEGGLMIHSSVKTRLEALDCMGQRSYAPLAIIGSAPKDASVIVSNSDWINAPPSLLQWVD